jgi:hypothetical protein
MKRRQLSSLLTILGMVLGTFPSQTKADFLIEFTDGRQVTDGQYVEKEQTIEIYSSLGTIGFRKADIKQITALDTKQNAGARLETMSAKPSSSTSASVPSSIKDNRKKSGGDNTAIEQSKTKLGGADKTAEPSIEQIDEQYQDTAQELNKVWEKHIQDVNSGASDDVLAENRRQLDKLNLERHELIKAARKADPDDLPAWAQ